MLILATVVLVIYTEHFQTNSGILVVIMHLIDFALGNGYRN